MRQRIGQIPVASSVKATAALVGAVAAVAAVIVGQRVVVDTSTGPQPVGHTVDELAHAAVLISAVDSDGESFPIGSGSILTEDGLILTAASRRGLGLSARPPRGRHYR
jgi:hypothetical protein